MTTDKPNFVRSFLAHADGMTSASFSPDGLTLATGGYDCKVRLWDTRTWQEERVLPGHRRGEVAFSPDGSRLISGGLHKDAYIFDTSTWQIVSTLDDTNGVWALDFRPDGSEVILVEPAEEMEGRFHRPIEFWDINTWTPTGTADIGVDSVYGLAFSPNGKTVAFPHSPNGLVSIWSADFLQKLTSFPAHDLATWDVSFSPDGAMLATGGADNVARIWDTVDWTMRHELSHEEFEETVVAKGFRNAVLCTAFSPDGKWLVTGGLDGVLTIWRLPEIVLG